MTYRVIDRVLRNMYISLDAQSSENIDVGEEEEMKDFILSEIYFKTATGDFITMGELETLSGSTGEKLRPLLEDLKEERLIVEHQEGFQVSRHGLIICRTKWD